MLLLVLPAAYAYLGHLFRTGSIPPWAAWLTLAWLVIVAAGSLGFVFYVARGLWRHLRDRRSAQAAPSAQDHFSSA